MRREDLPTMSTAPIDRVRRALAGLDVVGALPVVGMHPSRAYVLAATPQGLAIIAERRRTWGGGADHIVIRLANWSSVGLEVDPTGPGTGEPPTPRPGGRRSSAVVRVGRRAFQTLLEGAAGKQALREFMAAVQQCRPGERGYVDYDAASMLTR